MNILVLYQSRTGNTRQVAEAITRVSHEHNHTVTVKSVIEVRKADVDAADLLFIGTWIQGFILFGVKPAGATLWVPALPSLAGKPVGIFCTYAFNPHRSLNTLADMLRARGAHIVGQQAFHRRRLDDGVAPYVESVLRAAERETERHALNN